MREKKKLLVEIENKELKNILDDVVRIERMEGMIDEDWILELGRLRVKVGRGKRKRIEGGKMNGEMK